MLEPSRVAEEKCKLLTMPCWTVAWRTMCELIIMERRDAGEVEDRDASGKLRKF